MADTPAPEASRRITFPILVGVIAGLVSVAVGSITIYTFFVPKPDERFAQMISTAEGMKTALERIANTVSEQPNLVGTDEASAKALAVTADAVTKEVQAAAKSQGFRVTATDLWGDRMTVRKGTPVLLEGPNGQMFGIANENLTGLSLNNRFFNGPSGSVISFKVGPSQCTAFVHRNDNNSVELTLRCD